MADIHVIDPFADTVISLRNPSAEFAVWESDEEAQSPHSPPYGNDASENSNMDSGSDSKDPVHELTEDMAAASLNEESRIIQYHVSSSHLILASKVFFVKASPLWNKGKLADGKYHHSAEGWDPEAFLVLMNIFHLRHSQLPAKISLEMMAKLAVLADFYDCEEAVEVPVRRWIEIWRKESELPSEYGRELILWICISQVFLLSDVHSLCTQTAMNTATGPMQPLGLPIGQTIDILNHYRNMTLNRLMIKLARSIDNFRRADCTCPQSNTLSQYSSGCAAFNKAWDYIMAAFPVLGPHPTVEDCLKLRSWWPFQGTSIKLFEDRLVYMLRVHDSTVQQPESEPSHEYTYESCEPNDRLHGILLIILRFMNSVHDSPKSSRIPSRRPQPPWGLPFRLPASCRRRIDIASSAALVRRAQNLTEEEYHQWPSERIPSEHRPMIQVKVEFEASSRHLGLASEPFRKELARRKATAHGDATSRSYLELGLHEEKLLCTFLNVLHLHNSKVPKCLPIEKLETIGKCAMKYQCTEAFSEWARVWVMELPKVDVNTSFSALLKRAHISWMFDLQDDFGKVTLEAIKRSEGGEKTTSSVIGQLAAEIDRARQAAFYRIVTGVVNLPSARNMKRTRCTYPGDDGSPLQCALSSLCLQLGSPACPHQGWSLEHLYLLVVHSPRFPHRDVKGAVDNYHCCYKQLEGVKVLVERVWEELEGLDLEDIKKRMSG